MKANIIVAVIAALPPTFAALLAYLAGSRSLRRSVGTAPGVPLTRLLERLDEKVDRLVEGQSAIRERLAKFEGIAASETRERSA
jgi:hypothetical protein